MAEQPRVRLLEVIPFMEGDEKQYLLRDPLRICEETLTVNQMTLFIMTMLDGTHTIPDIQAEINRRTGSIVPSSEIEGLMDQLDSVFLMESPKFFERMHEMKKEYHISTERMPTHAGMSYKADPAELKQQLGELFAVADEQQQNEPDEPVRGIVAPHIDINVGGPCFAAAFRRLRDCDAELYIILGTAHSYGENIFTLVEKDFITPLGVMPLDRDAASQLTGALGPRLLDEQFNHRNEHSIEFQTVFLRHVLGPDNPAAILPILCGSFHELLESNTAPGEHEAFAAMAEQLRDIASQRKTCFIAGVDLAHVGLRFQDPAAPDQAMLEEVERRDRQLIDILSRLDKDEFFAHFTEDGDKRRVCGLPPLALLLHSMDAARGELLGYDQMVDQTGSMVSYTGMAFY